jgi:hypothetical protein
MSNPYLDINNYDPITGRKKTKKQKARERLARNRLKGEWGEQCARLHLLSNLYVVERTHKGRDFDATPLFPLSGKEKTEHCEAKNGPRAHLSKAQQKMKNKKKKNYHVYRPPFSIY